MKSTSVSLFLYPLLSTGAWAQAHIAVAARAVTTAKPSTAVSHVINWSAMATSTTSSKRLTTTTSSKLPTSTTSKKLTSLTTAMKPTSLTTTMKPASLTTTTKPTSTTSATGSVVTDQAYIDTVLRHHNVHRANHSAVALTWSPSLAETARQIGSSCVYAHNMTVGGGGYGQNIGYGFRPVNMGQFITTGLYNSEVNSYTYFGGEPDLNTLHAWGHFSQIAWKGTASVGCYSYDCTATGVANTVGRILPYFTVCNYAPQGNIIGSFKTNVGVSLGRPTVFETYGCTSALNCVSA